jgi:hypothetical protein
MVLLETKTGSVEDGITELYKNKNKNRLCKGWGNRIVQRKTTHK